MAQVRAHIAHFSIGEFSVAGLARVDYEPTAFAAETQENIFSHVIGKGLCRPGLEYIGTTDSSNKARLVPFKKSVSDVAILEFTASKMRVIVDDAYVTRPAVTAAVTNGDFSSATGWTTSATDGAVVAITGGELTMQATSRGSSCYCEQQVTVNETGTEHCLEIQVTNGAVRFSVGSTSGGDDYIPLTTLDEGYHSLTFTPTGNFYLRFSTRLGVYSNVTSCEVASAGVVEITAPWAESELFEIQFAQSQDVLFLAHANWQQRKIERRNNTTSWSIAKYMTEDGPFRTAPGDSVSLTAADTFADRTVTSDVDVFKSTHVGTLLRFYHEGLNASWQLAGDGQYIDPYIIRGVQETSDRVFTWTIQSATTATFSGTIRSQRSLTGPDGDFTDWAHTTGGTIAEGSSATGTYTGNTAESNLTSYTRWGFSDGEYTSGVVRMTIDYRGYSGFGIARIKAYTNAQSVEVAILEDITSTDPTRVWEIGAWSDAYEWPSAVGFFDGRLWWGGQDQFWGSASDAYYTFDDLDDGDAATIQRSIATGGQINTVNWFLPLQRLIIGTSGAEISARSSSFDEPLTPTNITLKEASSLGSAAIQPVKLDSRGVFVHRSMRSVHAVLYSFDANDYMTDDLTELNEDITGDGITQLDVSREPENYVWAVRSDGQVAVLNYDWSEDRQVKGWFRFVSDGASGEVESVCVVPGVDQDRVYMAVKRTINGSTVRYVEKLAKHDECIGGTTHRMADAHTYTAGPASSVTHAHLAAETGLVGWATNASNEQVPLTGLSADASGVIALGATYTDIVVGLPYSCKYKSSKLAYGAQGGTALMQRKRVDQLGLLLTNTHRDAIQFGPSFSVLRNMDLSRDGSTVESNTVYTNFDEETYPFPSEWDTDSRVCIQVDAPYPATLLGLVIGVDTKEK